MAEVLPLQFHVKRIPPIPPVSFPDAEIRANTRDSRSFLSCRRWAAGAKIVFLFTISIESVLRMYVEYGCDTFQLGQYL